MNATARKLCSICKTRPVASLRNRNEAGMGSDHDFCVPCFDEAGWENTHSDDAHEDFESLTVRKSNFRTKAELEAWKVEMREETKNCWICHPERNEAKREYTPRQGTSRAGMVINVSIRAAGETKAAETEARLSVDEQNNRFAFKTVTNKKTGEVTMTAKSAQESFIFFWDARGRFIGGSVSENGKTRKIRNVAEALRLAR